MFFFYEWFWNEKKFCLSFIKNISHHVESKFIRVSELISIGCNRTMRENEAKNVIMTSQRPSISLGRCTSSHWSYMHAWNRTILYGINELWWEVSLVFFSFFLYFSVAEWLDLSSIYVSACASLSQIYHSNSIEIFCCSAQLTRKRI